MKRIVLITLVVILSVLFIMAGGCAALDRKQEQSRDVAITNILADSSCVQGDTLHVVVTVENQSNYDQTFDVELTDTTDGLEIGNQSVTLSAAGESGIDEVVDRTFDAETDETNFFGGQHCSGDVNGDGYEDLLISACEYNQTQGRVYLYYGGTKTSIDNVCDLTFTGEAQNSGYGACVNLADLSNDDYADVVIGGWKYNNNRGRVWLYYNKPHSSTEVNFDWDTTSASVEDHILKVEISPVGGEEDTADNTMTTTVNVKSKVKEK